MITDPMIDVLRAKQIPRSPLCPVCGGPPCVDDGRVVSCSNKDCCLFAAGIDRSVWIGNVAVVQVIRKHHKFLWTEEYKT